jgi:hypothetical protein
MRVMVIAAAMLLAACQGERDPKSAYTVSGKYVGPSAFREISLAESHVVYLGTPDAIKKREAQRLNDRYSERVTFNNNGVMLYQKIIYGAFAAEESEEELLKRILEDRWYQEKSLVFDAKAVKHRGNYIYLAQQTPTHSCFVFRGFFGLAPEGRGGRGDEEMRGAACYPASSRSAEAVESEMNNLLSLIRFDDGSYNKAHAAKATAP